MTGTTKTSPLKEYIGIPHSTDSKSSLRHYDYGKKSRFLKLITLSEYAKMLFYDVLLNAVSFIHNHSFLMCSIFVKRVPELPSSPIRTKRLTYPSQHLTLLQ